jgi:ABC-type lipoprotein export system ATPase subunit
MKGVWPRGSEWRKWDLHVHSPGTKLNDQFKRNGGDVWDAYCQKLETSEVQAFGITDYFSVNTYFDTLREFRKRYPLSEKVFFPNIELRTSDVVNKGNEEVNVHLIFNPYRPDYELKIAAFLQNLKTNKTVDGGRNIKASELKQTHDFEEATTTREFIRAALDDVYGKSADLALELLIFTAANNDGLRAERGKKRKAVISDELDKFSHGFFGNAGNVQYYLGTDRYEGKEEASVPKPTLSGSDAHSLGDLDARLGNAQYDASGKLVFEPTWIKADPTFEGLKQVLYEPGSRVHIGETPPVYYDVSRVIRSVKLSNPAGWFDEVEIPLNPGLVSVIGKKGSGKSALAEIIAHAADSWATDEPGSFKKRAGAHLKNLDVTLTWGNGKATSKRLGDEQSDDKKVRYLSQKFVERLCADDHIGIELVREIEAVIFSNLDPTETLNASNFEELRVIKTEGIHDEGQRLKQEVVDLIREECRLLAEAKKLGDKRQRIATLKNEEKGLLEQMPKPATDEEKKVLEQLQKRRDELVAAQNIVAGDKQRIQKIADIKTKLTSFRAQMARFSRELAPLLDEVGVPPADRSPFTPSFPGNTDAPLDKRAKELQTVISGKEGAEQNPAQDTIRWLEAQIKTLEQKESLDKARQKRIKEIQTRIAAIGTEVKRIEAEIRQIEGPGAERIKATHAERVASYGTYFENLKQERKTLEELYEPVRKKLAPADGKDDQNLEFSIRWEVDLPRWLERGTKLFDQRKTLPYGNFQQLSQKAAEILVPAWSSGESDAIRAAHDDFLSEFRKKEYKARDYLREGVEDTELLEWLYEVDHVRLAYGLKYNRVDLEKLSPGTKGIVLLILYLGMDTADSRPLIVDQPDENLDNESIYELLRKYFQNAKSRRQIILISHNPNLVVNADSEQVLIATATPRENGLPHITYQMGSLENSAEDGSGIRQRACRILEGGDTAFLKREGRYAITRKKAEERDEAREQ